MQEIYAINFTTYARKQKKIGGEERRKEDKERMRRPGKRKEKNRKFWHLHQI